MKHLICFILDTIKISLDTVQMVCRAESRFKTTCVFAPTLCKSSR